MAPSIGPHLSRHRLLLGTTGAGALTMIGGGTAWARDNGAPQPLDFVLTAWGGPAQEGTRVYSAHGLPVDAAPRPPTVHRHFIWRFVPSLAGVRICACGASVRANQDQFLLWEQNVTEDQFDLIFERNANDPSESRTGINADVVAAHQYLLQYGLADHEWAQSSRDNLWLAKVLQSRTQELGIQTTVRGMQAALATYTHDLLTERETELLAQYRASQDT